MRIVALSDLDFQGSGYLNIIIPICQGLAEKGHEIKVAGIRYGGDEHTHDFSIIPCPSIQDSLAVIGNLNQVWKFDVLLVALDIPLQREIIREIAGRIPTRDFRYMGIFPIEADPLIMSWAAILSQMNKAFIISEFGANEARKAGITTAEHLVIGVDTGAWRPPTEKERSRFRTALDLEDDFVILTIADNQERKHLSAAFEALEIVDQTHHNFKYLMVTRPDMPLGYDLDELALRFGVQDRFMKFGRGLDYFRLWSLYAASDAFLLTSKAEGLSMPILEAMSVGLPVLATGCTAILDHLEENRGFPIDYAYKIIDPFGNGNRYFIDPYSISSVLCGLMDGKYRHDKEAALKYIQSRQWENTIKQIDDVLQEWEE
ncbi:hypothetical protein AYK26_07670 [Euryarchaeota archaeon SM23-78]|nr:MAG: hypothetical protein AYK26_07670 [Euryarchaeota archaeon SM23-78]